MTFQWAPFSDKQLDAMGDSDARINAMDGPVRSGKTVSANIAWTNFIPNAPHKRLLMTGVTKDTLYRNVLADMFDIWGMANYKYNSSTGVILAFGKEIHIVGVNDIKALKKIQGMTVGGWYADEITNYPFEVVKMAMTRLSMTGARAFWTMNPDSPFHPIFVDYLTNATLLKPRNGRPPILKRWKFDLDDNLSLEDEYKESLKAQFHGLFYKRYIEGQWVAAEGAVYDMFDEALHVVSELPAGPVLTYLVPIDYGTSNPTAFLKLAVVHDRQDKIDRVYVIDEYYYDSRVKGRQKTDSEYSQDLKAFIQRIAPTIFVDPSAASFKAQLRKDVIRTVKDADNSVLDGIRLVSSFLANRRLFFVKGKTPNLLKEIVSYVWDPTAQKRGEDEPLKENDHALDALRYGVYTHFKRDGIALGPVAKPAGA